MTLPRSAAFDPYEAPTIPERASPSLLSPADPLVLVAEANGDARRIHCQSLNGLGYRTVACGRGQRVLDIARWHRPDVALVDFSIGGREGARATWAMKQELPDMFIVVMVRAGSLGLEEVRAVRCDAFVAKPFEVLVLERLLGEVRARKARQVVKRCGCGRAWTREDWKQLPLCGTMRGVELRNCACGSSLALWSTTSGLTADRARPERAKRSDRQAMVPPRGRA